MTKKQKLQTRVKTANDKNKKKRVNDKEKHKKNKI